MTSVMHVDMDAFYASVALRAHPDLRDRPVWVGGSHRGVVLSANYPARAFGVRGGMAVVRARRLCPVGIALRPDFATFAAASAGVRAILETVTPGVEMASIDEAYLWFADVTPQGLVDLGERIRALVFDEQQITCSVGIGPNRLVAKMASVAAKPDGLVAVTNEQIVAFLHPLPVERLVGVGPATAARLRQLGVRTVGDLAAVSSASLRASFGPRAGAVLAALAAGRDVRRGWSGAGERGMGCQRTFTDDLNEDQVRAELLRVCERVGGRMRRAGLVGSVLTVHVRYADFSSRSWSSTLAQPVDSTAELYAAGLRLLARARRSGCALRQVGVRVTGLRDRAGVWLQPRLDEPDLGWAEAQVAVDHVNKIFGRDAVRRAVLIREHGSEHLS